VIESDVVPGTPVRFLVDDVGYGPR